MARVGFEIGIGGTREWTLMGEGMALVLQTRVAFDFFELFADLFASHPQRLLESPTLPAIVQNTDSQERERELRDQLQRAGG